MFNTNSLVVVVNGVCIDKLFEFPMLYTGITRASENIKFYSTKSKEKREKYLLKHSGEKEIKILIELFEKTLKFEGEK